MNNNHIFSDSITGVVDDGRQLKPVLDYEDMGILHDKDWLL
jgi:hypothetical protein